MAEGRRSAASGVVDPGLADAGETSGPGGRRRVVVTGVGVVCPIGASVDAAVRALRRGQSGVAEIPAWAEIGELATRVGGVVRAPLSGGDRKKLRTMGRVARLALTATEEAVNQAGIAARLGGPRVGLAYGSTHGSSSAYVDFARPLLRTNSFAGLPSTSFLKFMSHTCAANLAQYYGIKGRVVSTCAACVSGSQAIGAGMEAIAADRADVMICGGAEELHWTHAGVFDVMMATSSRFNTRPTETPRPFDAARDGLVIGEGAGTLVLEGYDHAMGRAAPILGEVLGYGTNCDGEHVTQPSVAGMVAAMQLALDDARLRPNDIDYINAHATATTVGDVAESVAIERLFGREVPVSSLKGAMGHTLGACGAIEAALSMTMGQRGFLAPTRNLEAPDPACARLDYIVGAPRPQRARRVLSTNFAFGGVNTALILLS